MTMKVNGDMPAMPTDVKALYEAMTDKQDSWGKAALGMTKREMMAMAAMQGILSSLTEEDWLSANELARCAVRNSDALLAELERTK